MARLSSLIVRVYGLLGIVLASSALGMTRGIITLLNFCVPQLGMLLDLVAQSTSLASETFVRSRAPSRSNFNQSISQWSLVFLLFSFFFFWFPTCWWLDNGGALGVMLWWFDLGCLILVWLWWCGVVILVLDLVWQWWPMVWSWVLYMMV